MAFPPGRAAEAEPCLALPGCARLLADIGGTNARFAWQDAAGGAIGDIVTLPCAEHATLANALQRYLGIVGRDAPPDCAIAIANPVLGDRVRMTNHHWSFSISSLKAQFGFARLQVLNDFTALALALPGLAQAELHQVGGRAAMPGHALGLVGPGTGLGVSGLLPGGEAGRVDRTGGTALWLPLHGEGGHVTLAAQGAREHAVLAELERRHGHVSAERVVSGQGLANLYSALARMDSPGAPELRLSAADITERALLGDASCGEALDLFCAFLGSVAGNLALTLGAQGGVYIGGGMVPRFLDWFVQSPFRQRFEAKGRFSAYLATVPVFVIVARQSPALRGAACALDLQG